MFDAHPEKNKQTTKQKKSNQAASDTYKKQSGMNQQISGQADVAVG